MPIIMLTAKGDEVDKIIGLELGADDYITKPFSIKELIARTRTILRRIYDENKQPLKKTFTYAELQIDYNSYEVRVRGKKVDLSPTELKLLFFFSQNPGRVYTRNQILDQVWNDNTFVTARLLTFISRRCEVRLKKIWKTPQYILTVRGFGYKFADKK